MSSEISFYRLFCQFFPTIHPRSLGFLSSFLSSYGIEYFALYPREVSSLSWFHLESFALHPNEVSFFSCVLLSYSIEYTTLYPRGVSLFVIFPGYGIEYTTLYPEVSPCFPYSSTAIVLFFSPFGPPPLIWGFEATWFSFWYFLTTILREVCSWLQAQGLFLSIERPHNASFHLIKHCLGRRTGVSFFV